MSFMAEITKHLNKLADVCNAKNPDAKHNKGNLLGAVYFWTKVEGFAKAKKDDAWKLLESEGIIADDLKGYDPGDYNLTESPHFVVTAKVSNKIKRFSDTELAKLMQASKYKVPAPFTREMVEAAKVPTNPQVTKTVTER